MERLRWSWSWYGMAVGVRRIARWCWGQVSSPSQVTVPEVDVDLSNLFAILEAAQLRTAMFSFGQFYYQTDPALWDEIMGHWYGEALATTHQRAEQGSEAFRERYETLKREAREAEA